MKTKPPIILLTGPSGAGKTTIAEKLLATRMSIKRFITCTTRPKRVGEKHGVHYWFLSAEEFEAQLAQEHFFEWAKVYEHYYGSSKKEMERRLKGKTAILVVIDVQGFKTVKKHYPEAFAVFIDAPKSNLKHRLLERHADPKDVKRRLDKVTEEEKARKLADLVVENRDGELAVAAKTVREAVKKLIERK